MSLPENLSVAARVPHMPRFARSAALACGTSLVLAAAACTGYTTGETGTGENHSSSPGLGPGHDYAQFARNILPHGQYGAVPPPSDASTQAKMYDALTPLFDNVTAQDLQTDFKSEVFGVGKDGPATSESVPRAGVTILRDRYHVPHDMKIYPGAKHGFFNDTSKIYDEPAAQDSWGRVLAFFEERLVTKAEG